MRLKLCSPCLPPNHVIQGDTWEMDGFDLRSTEYSGGIWSWLDEPIKTTQDKGNSKDHRVGSTEKGAQNGN